MSCILISFVAVATASRRPDRIRQHDDYQDGPGTENPSSGSNIVCVSPNNIFTVKVNLFAGELGKLSSYVPCSRDPALFHPKRDGLKLYWLTWNLFVAASASMKNGTRAADGLKTRKCMNMRGSLF